MKLLAMIFVSTFLTCASASAADYYRTHSQGYVFQGPTQAGVIRACVANRVTRERECRRNVEFVRDRGPQRPPQQPPRGPQQPPRGPQQPPQQPPRGPQRPPDRGEALPNGSYQQTCRNMNRSGNYLSADCANMAGRYVYSQLDLNRCDGGDIANIDGILRCNPR